MMRSPVRAATLVLLLLAGCSGDPEPEGATETTAEPCPQQAIEETPAPPTAAELAQQAAEAARARAEEDRRLAEEEARSVDEARRQAEEEARERAEAERAAFEREYPLYGVCTHFLAQVFATPARTKVIGYMRRGSTFRAKRAVRGPDCAGRWHEVPGGGFVCQGNGYLIGDSPQSFEPSPRPAALDSALPYAYAWVSRDDVPQYWRIPTPEEERTAAQAIEALVASEEAQALPAAPAPDAGVPPAGDAAVAVTEDAEEPAPESGPEAEAAEVPETRAEAVEAPPPPGQAPTAGDAAEEETPDEPLPSFVRMRMQKGFYVSIDRLERDQNRRFYRTIRGAYVRADRVQPNEPPEGRGVVLGEQWQLPVAFVYRHGVRKLQRRERDGMLLLMGDIAPHTPLTIVERFRRGRHPHIVSHDGTIVRESAVRIATRVDRPADVPASSRWVHVDLSEQTLVAYEGDTPVFATLVSTGKAGHETPTGLFRIESKHVSTTMDDFVTPDGAYSIEDVPWTMYFDGSYALHGAFWHSSFGRPRSHGCVNLTPTDARWLFQWTTPTLPQGWHGMFTSRHHPGTWVYITE